MKSLKIEIIKERVNELQVEVECIKKRLNDLKAQIEGNFKVEDIDQIDQLTKELLSYKAAQAELLNLIQIGLDQ